MKKSMIRIILPVFLALIMVIGIVPMVPKAEAAEPSPIVLDFMDFADKAPLQSWWSGLRDTKVSGIKGIGMMYGVSPTASYTAALKDLEKYVMET